MMNINTFLEARPDLVLPELVQLLEEYGEERCSVLSGKIKARTKLWKPSGLIEYCPFCQQPQPMTEVVFEGESSTLTEMYCRVCRHFINSQWLPKKQ
jgi:hypothetical protein